MFVEEIRTKQDRSYISFCSLDILYNCKLFLMTTSLGTNAFVVTRVHCISSVPFLPISEKGHNMTTRVSVSLNNNATLNYEQGGLLPGDVFITKTYLYNFDPLKPHFHVVKLGFTGVHIIFLVSVQKIDFGYSVEPPRRCGFNEYPQSMFRAEILKISDFYLKTFSFWW